MSIWIRSKTCEVWELESLKESKWDFPYWQASQKSEFSLESTFLLQLCRIWDKTRFEGCPNLLCHTSLLEFKDTELIDYNEDLKVPNDNCPT